MNRLELKSVLGGKLVRTIIGETQSFCPLGNVNRVFTVNSSNQLWVPDFSCVST